MSDKKKTFLVISNEPHTLLVKRGVMDMLEDTEFIFEEVNKPIVMPERIAFAFTRADREKYRMFENADDIIPFKVEEAEPEATDEEEVTGEPETDETDEPVITDLNIEGKLVEGPGTDEPFDAVKFLRENVPFTVEKLNTPAIKRTELLEIAVALEVDHDGNTPDQVLVSRIIEATKE